MSTSVVTDGEAQISYTTSRDLTFHDFFNDHLLPIEARHGARLVGRWETDDHEVIAVWEYDDLAAFERIEAAVRADPDSSEAQKQRTSLGLLFTEKHETSPVPPSRARMGKRRSEHR